MIAKTIVTSKDVIATLITNDTTSKKILSILLDKLNNLINTQPGRKAVTITEKTDFVPSYKILVSDPATIFSLGWEPQISMKDLAKMMLTQE